MDRAPAHDRLLTVPNLLSAIRLVLIPVFVYLLLVAHANGWAVAIHYRSSSKEADTLAAEIKAGGGRAVALGADLATLDDFSDMFGRANAGWGFCSLLVNSASTMPVRIKAGWTELQRTSIF